MNTPPRVILHLDAARGFGRGMLSGIARYSALNGPWTFYRKTPTYLASGPDMDLQEIIRSWQPDGIICSISHTEKLESLEIPVVGYDPNDYAGPIPCVVSDHAATGRLAAQHLLDFGHRKFAFCGFNSLSWSQARCEAFCNVIKDTGAMVHIYNAPRITTSWAKEESKVGAWIKALPKPIGLFCVNDDRAASIIEICRTLGFGVPEDISIIGADDDEYICELENPQLTSVRIASDQAGYEAAELLHRMMEGPEKMESQRISAHATGVTARRSTDILMIQNAVVRKALRFIRENINQPINVTDIVDATSLSHRALNNHFHKELGTSIGTQLTRSRIDYITRLLTDTDMQIQQVATAVGYDDDRHFSRYFKRATGLTPQAYRRKMLPP